MKDMRAYRKPTEYPNGRTRDSEGSVLAKMLALRHLRFLYPSYIS